jgi:hydrogenase maturation protease
MHLAHELLSRYDRAVIVDAMERGQCPGTLYVLEVKDVEPESRIDTHLALPARALGVAKALGALPATVFMVGCEPAIVDELTTELSPAVSSAVDDAVSVVLRLAAPQNGEISNQMTG